MLSIILLSYCSKERISAAYGKVSTVMTEQGIPFEFIVVDDGSEDDSFSMALDLEKQNENVRAYQLSRNYGSNYAVFAGLSLCRGDCATFIPDDEQLPYAKIVEMYRLWKAGEKVIVPYRTGRDDGFLNNIAARTFYSIINRMSEVRFPRGGADAFLIDRELIDLLNERIHPVNTAIIPEVLRLGFSPCFIPYERVRGTNTRSRWTLKKKMRFFKDIFFPGHLAHKDNNMAGVHLCLPCLLYDNLLRIHSLIWKSGLLGRDAAGLDIHRGYYFFLLRDHSLFAGDHCRVYLEDLRGGQGAAGVHHQEEGWQ